MSWYGVLHGLAFLGAWLGWKKIMQDHKISMNDQQEITLLIAMLLSGLVGGRLWFLLTSPLGQALPASQWLRIWEGGTGWYGVLFGGLAGLGAWLWFAKIPQKRLFLATAMDAAALVLPFAQALARWGNYFNHELFGPPTNSWLGIFIPLANRPLGLEQFERFQPLFLYESTSWLLLGLGLWWLASRKVMKEMHPIGTGYYFTLYAFGFGTMRFGLEWLRLDPQLVWLGLRANHWASIAVAGVSLLDKFLRGDSSLKKLDLGNSSGLQ